jgi:hypothetical protein
VSELAWRDAEPLDELAAGRGEDQRHRWIALEALEYVVDEPLARGVQVRVRIVEEQKIGAERERPRQADAPANADGEVGG